MTPYNEGQQAYKEDGREAVNPYMEGTEEYKEWEEGYIRIQLFCNIGNMTIS